MLFLAMFGAIKLSVEKTGKPDTEWNVTAISTGSNASNLTGVAKTCLMV